MVVQPGQDWNGDYDTGALHRPTQRRRISGRMEFSERTRGRDHAPCVAARSAGVGARHSLLQAGSLKSEATTFSKKDISATIHADVILLRNQTG
jgi:hypothetical protein